MKYRAILEAFYGEPLAILPEKLEAIRHFLHTKAAGEDVPEAEIRAIVAGSEWKKGQIEAVASNRRQDGIMQVGNIGVIQVFGVLSQRAGMMAEASGGVSAERVGAQLDRAMADPSIKSIVLAFDSPGGSVFGIQELGDKIRGARDQKKVIGLADPMAASAAYWLLSQTSEANVTPSGQVGSIGVISAHEDWSKAYEAAGVKTTLVTAGKYKAEGNPFGALDEEAREELQRKVDTYYAQFVNAVAKGRGVTEARVQKDFGQGRMFTAKAAGEAGLVDKVATLAQVVQRLGGSKADLSTQKARARMEEQEDDDED